ncbi:DUF397 domain-containing protein [Saccharothrix obliqua]|uniref:DUF397 domain-containing protein n=1 Tax=Saccharothrix obliqua TaxID=2861747 RepID=UPI001C5E45FB|nr:DUF397 domain-containing protein [Saccharothrix obliqua]MBW4721245.1 DUF397 domain-containing protein [Saccharothrix obliqua]
MSEWRKSTRSTNTDSCVEVARGLVAVRDSKNPDGPVLGFREGGAVGALLAAVRGGRLDG